VAEPNDRVIVVNSFSKSWAMTGWRLGWITAPPAVGPVLEKLTEFNIAGPAGFIQQAGLVAVEEGEPFVREIVARYREARELTVARLSAMPRVRLPRPAAAFYAFFQVEGVTDTVAFAKDLLRATGVGLAPGEAFGPGGEGCMRLCFAASLPALTAALDRFERYLAGSSFRAT
jgi:aspartate aminotransferase